MTHDATGVFVVPFRGGTLRLKKDTPASDVALIALLNMQDPKIDAFCLAVGVNLKDPEGNPVWPTADLLPKELEAPSPAPSEGPAPAGEAEVEEQESGEKEPLSLDDILGL